MSAIDQAIAAVEAAADKMHRATGAALHEARGEHRAAIEALRHEIALARLSLPLHGAPVSISPGGLGSC